MQPVSLPFREIWCVDFEFTANPGNKPTPVCMVALEKRSGRVLRIWQDELLSCQTPPLSTKADSLFVSYFASAELGCYMQLGWQMPERILDLFTEFRALTNGARLTHGNSLIGAMAYHGIPSIKSAQKDFMRDKIISGGPWDYSEQQQILKYCQSDVESLSHLLSAMLPKIDLPRALLRGRYMAAVAKMESNGIPIDTFTLARLRANWDGIKHALVEDVNQTFDVYDNLIFKSEKFTKYLEENRIPWPVLPSGKLTMTDQVFKDRAKVYPQLEALRQCRKTLSLLRLNKISIGDDNRNRCLLSPFGTRTGRNTPSNSMFIFGAAAWLRSLVKPTEGKGLAYIDWSAQEIGIAAALSMDPLLMKGYTSGDPYLAFGKQAGILPPDATKKSHKAERDRLKAVVLGTNYGMGSESIASQVGISNLEAKQLLQLHQSTYQTFWKWAEDNIARADLNGVAKTVFGWPIYTVQEWNPRAALNFPMQANGAEMMRIAAMLATEAGIKVCAPIHDAFLIEDNLETLDETISKMQDIMAKASRHILDNFEVRTDVEIIRYPERYCDERGIAMWEIAMQRLDKLEADTSNLRAKRQVGTRQYRPVSSF